MQVDFAENFNMREQNEMQTAYRNTKALSIFVAFVWSRNQNISFTLPSFDITQDKFVADAASQTVLTHTKTVLPEC